MTEEKLLEALFIRYPLLTKIQADIKKAIDKLTEVYNNKNKLLICGNGGSAADSEHIAGELLKSFQKNRDIDQEFKNQVKNLFPDKADKICSTLEGALPVISLTSHISLNTAFANDANPVFSFAQQVYGLGNSGDGLIAISTSGNSENILLAVMTAKAKNISVIGLTGEIENKLSELSDVTIKAPAAETHLIQEYHLPIYHTICSVLETRFFK